MTDDLMMYCVTVYCLLIKLTCKYMSCTMYNVLLSIITPACTITVRRILNGHMPNTVNVHTRIINFACMHACRNSTLPNATHKLQ